VLRHLTASILLGTPVELPAPRDQITTRQSAEFVALRTEIARLLHAGAHERTADR
jgi:NitT/TauT family transport system ATP-binding protein